MSKNEEKDKVDDLAENLEDLDIGDADLDDLNDEYVVNGVPLVDTIFDSNYWIWIDNLTFTVPVYSVFSWFYEALDACFISNHGRGNCCSMGEKRGR